MISVLVGIALTLNPTQQSRKIAFVEWEVNGIHTVNTLTKADKKMPIKVPLAGDLCYCPSRRLMAFSGAWNIESSIYTYTYSFDAKKLNVIRVAKYEGGSLNSLVFSKDGKYLYALNHTDGMVRYSLDLKKWQDVPVLNTSVTSYRTLSFSPSGRKFAITTYDPKDLLVGNVEQNRLVIKKTYLNSWEYASTPMWESESSLVFAGIDDKKTGLWRYNLVGGRRQRLLDNRYCVGRYVSISCDRATLAFVSMSPGAEQKGITDWAIWVLDLNTLKVDRLTKVKIDAFPPECLVWLE